MIRAFQQARGVADMVVVADAGMLSAADLKELDALGLRFIVGSRATKAPGDLESHFRWHGDAFRDGQIIDTITPRVANAAARAENNSRLRAEPLWDPEQHPRSWRALWAYSQKRAVRDGRTLTAQENRAKAVVAGEKAAHSTRFVKTKNGARTLDKASLARARRLAGLKGYVSNIPATLMPAHEVISSYHGLWQVEQSFRMSKSDLRARPVSCRRPGWGCWSGVRGWPKGRHSLRRGDARVFNPRRRRWPMWMSIVRILWRSGPSRWRRGCTLRRSHRNDRAGRCWRLAGFPRG